MNSVEISSDALTDLEIGVDFYEKQDPGVGEHFLSTLKAEIDGLSFTGGIHKKVYKDLHRLVCRKFPFAIFYAFDARSVLVVAVGDCRREPEWIREHLD